MNAYFLFIGDRDVHQEYIDYWSRSERQTVFAIVVARTPAHAKFLYLKKSHDAYTEWTSIKNVIQIAKGIDREPIVIEPSGADDDLWDAAWDSRKVNALFEKAS